jgi:hypothetical protein
MVRFRAGSAHDQSHPARTGAAHVVLLFPHGRAIVSKVITKKERSLLEEASEMFGQAAYLALMGNGYRLKG